MLWSRSGTSEGRALLLLIRAICMEGQSFRKLHSVFCAYTKRYGRRIVIVKAEFSVVRQPALVTQHTSRNVSSRIVLCDDIPTNSNLDVIKQFTVLYLGLKIVYLSFIGHIHFTVWEMRCKDSRKTSTLPVTCCAIKPLTIGWHKKTQRN